MHNSRQVADYFLSLSDPDVGELISNLKLQKLVYYAQGFHLAMYDSKLFSEKIIAWAHGPVVEDLYRSFKEYSSNAIPAPENFDATIFNTNERNLLDEVYQVYGQFSAWKLRNMTHSERPWVETEINHEIPTELMKEFFKEYLV